MYEKCAFTGHRILQKDFDYNLLDKVIFNLVSGGTKTFFCGMAMGFDLTCAESVLNLKKDNKNIELIAVVPCRNQEEKYPEKTRERYRRAIEKCDKIITLSEEYYDGCMFVRDRFLVDNCDVLISYQRRKKGGTSYTVNYAKSKDVNIIEL
ncbi:MAG: DUF1273 domain-containing protein [Clostridia bacterium]|nr:DUF1273 domain-containing protein [Clostridia bacterium]